MGVGETKLPHAARSGEHVWLFKGKCGQGLCGDELSWFCRLNDDRHGGAGGPFTAVLGRGLTTLAARLILDRTITRINGMSASDGNAHIADVTPRNGVSRQSGTFGAAFGSVHQSGQLTLAGCSRRRHPDPACGWTYQGGQPRAARPWYADELAVPWAPVLPESLPPERHAPTAADEPAWRLAHGAHPVGCFQFAGDTGCTRT